MLWLHKKSWSVIIYILLHAFIVIITLTSSKGSDELAQMCSLARSIDAYIDNVLTLIVAPAKLHL